MNNMKTTYAVIGVIILIIIGGIIYNRSRATTTPIDTTSGQVSTTTTGQTSTTTSQGRYMAIEDYVRLNISLLSPVKEQLGGTFYVTSIETHGGTGTVSYEDGHNAYTADFTYTVDDDGRPAVASFKVR